MSNRAKGSNAERELLRLFTEHNWRAARVAGSGVNEDTSGDLIAGKLGRRGCVIEAKSSKSKYIYITKRQIEEFVLFSHMIGLQPVVAVRFNYEGWIFLNPDQLQDSGKNWVVSLEHARKNGKRFSQYFELEN